MKDFYNRKDLQKSIPENTMKQNKSSLFLVTLASGFLLGQNAGAYPTWMEEFTYQASGRLGDAATGAGNFWYNAIGSVYVTNTGSLNGLTNGLVQSFGGRIIIYPTNDYNHAPYEKWGNSGQYNPGTPAYPQAGTNLYFSFLYKFDDSGTPLDSVGQRVVQMQKQNSGLTSVGNISPFLLHARDIGSNTINLGISKYSGNGTAYPALTNWATTNLHYGQTFFVVCKLALRGDAHYPASPGDPYETNALWINPNPNTFGATEPLCSAAVDDGLDDTSPTGPGRFFVNISGQSAEMDEIRVGNFWPDVTPWAGQYQTTIFDENFDGRYTGDFGTSSYSGGSPTGCTNYVLAGGGNPNGCWQETMTPTTWDDFYAGQVQLMTVSGNTDTNPSDYVLSFDAKGSQAGNILFTLQTWPDNDFGGAGPVINATTNIQLTATNTWQTFSVNLGSFPELNNPTGATWQLAFQLNSWEWNGPGNTDTLTIDNIILVDNSPPTITLQPVSQSVPPGSGVTFSVSATGSVPLSYQWRLNGANIPGATGPAYSISNVQPTNGGSYDVLVANSFGAVASLIATLNVTAGTLPFADNFADRGSTNGLSGMGSGSNTNATRETGEPDHASKYGNHSVWLQWTAPADGVATFNTRGSSFDTLLAVYTGTSLGALTIVAANDDEVSGLFTSQVQFNAAAGTSYNIAVDGLGSANGNIVLSWNLVTDVPQIPMISAQPADVTVSDGGNATFSVAATGNTNLTYQWYYNDSLAIAGATNNSLTVSNVSLSNVGLYRVNVTSAAGQTVVSDEASLEIGPAGAHSYDKLEDLLASLFGDQSLASLGGKSFLAALSGGFPSVSAGSSDHQDISTYNATTDQGEPVQNGTGGATRWYLLTAADNSTLMLDTMGSAISNVMAVYILTNRNLSLPNPLQFVTNDNKNHAPDGTNSLVRFPGKTGTNYLIAVAPAVNGVQGAINLDWHVGIPPSVGGAGQSYAVSNGTTLAPLQGGDLNAFPAATYRWLWNGTNIPGQTDPTYSLANIQYYQGGTYSVVVSNFMGVVTNPIALVSVDAPLKLDLSTLPSYVRIWGSATQAVVLLSSTDLTSWQPLYTNQNTLLWINYQDTDSANRDKGFYWLKRWP